MAEAGDPGQRRLAAARKQGTTKGDWAKGLDQYPYDAKTHAAQTEKYDEAKGRLPGERTAAHINI